MEVQSVHDQIIAVDQLQIVREAGYLQFASHLRIGWFGQVDGKQRVKPAATRGPKRYDESQLVDKTNRKQPFAGCQLLMMDFKNIGASKVGFGVS